MPEAGSYQSAVERVQVIEGREAILQQALLLEELASRCGQYGAMHWLKCFLSESGSKRKYPYLVLLRKPFEGGASGDAGDVEAAVLSCEYRVFGLRTGAFTSIDPCGFRTVIAPEGERSRVATIAAKTLMEHGGRELMISYCEKSPDTSIPVKHANAEWVYRKRELAKTMVLEGDFEDVLAKFGKTTRRNFRYYRRKLIEKCDCEFVPDACGRISQEELTKLDVRPIFSLRAAEGCEKNLDACKQPGAFLFGLRTPGGEWLSLISGWRQGNKTVVVWQLNVAGHEKESLGTAMRSFLLEHEVSCGTRYLVFDGGTSHSMSHAFEHEEIIDLIVRKMSGTGAVAKRAIWAWGMLRSIMGRSTFFLDALCQDDLRWQNFLPTCEIGLNHRGNPHSPEEEAANRLSVSGLE